MVFVWSNISEHDTSRAAADLKVIMWARAGIM